MTERLTGDVKAALKRARLVFEIPAASSMRPSTSSRLGYLDEQPSRYLDEELIDELRRKPLPDRSDIDVAVPLARLVHDHLEAYGTAGGEELMTVKSSVASRSA